jgi:hypothetical protein
MLKFLVIIICVYLLLKWTVRPILRMLFQKALNDMAQKQGGTFYREYRYEPGGPKYKPEGSVNVDYVPPKKSDKRLPDDEGEYVDYVEIK